MRLRAWALALAIVASCALAQEVAFGVRTSVDAPLAAGEYSAFAVMLNNTGAEEAEVWVALDARGLALPAGAERSASLGTLIVGGRASTEWQVMAPSPGNYTLCVNVSVPPRAGLSYPAMPACLAVEAREAPARRIGLANTTIVRALPLTRPAASAVPDPLVLRLSLSREPQALNGTLRLRALVESDDERAGVVTVRAEGEGSIAVDPSSFRLPPKGRRTVGIEVTGADVLDVLVTVVDERGRELARERRLEAPEGRTDRRMLIPLLLLVPVIVLLVVKGRALERLLPGLYVQRFETVAEVREREGVLVGRRISIEGKVILDENYEYLHTFYVYDANGDYLAASSELPLDEGIYTVTGTLGRAEEARGYVQPGELVLTVDRARGDWQGRRSLFALRNHLRAVVALAVIFLIASRRLRDLSVIEPWGNLQYLAIAPFSLPVVPIVIAVAPLLAALVVGPLFCGWVCPVGLAHEAASSRLSRRLRALARFNDRNLKYIALLVLAVAVLAFRTPALCRACPYGDALARVPLVADRFSGSQIAADAYAGPPVDLRLAFLGVLVIAAIVVHPMFWCRDLCPYGALLSVLGITKWTEVRVQRAACVECGRCERVCPYELGVLSGTHMNECTSCGVCVGACFKNALSVGFSPERIRANLVPAALGLLVVGIILMFPFVGAKVPVTVDYTKCIKCGQCWERYPQYFAQDARTGFPTISEAAAVKVTGLTPEETERVVAVCPVGAIEAQGGPGG